MEKTMKSLFKIVSGWFKKKSEKPELKIEKGEITTILTPEEKVVEDLHFEPVVIEKVTIALDSPKEETPTKEVVKKNVKNKKATTKKSVAKKSNTKQANKKKK